MASSDVVALLFFAVDYLCLLGGVLLLTVCPFFFRTVISNMEWRAATEFRWCGSLFSKAF